MAGPIVCLIVLVAAALSACAPAGQDPADQSRADEIEPPRPDSVAGYMFRGRERPNWGPGWRGVILDGRILLDSPTSAGWAAVAAATPAEDGNRRTYTTPRLRLVIEAGACPIAGERALLPDRVTIDWDGGGFDGCGGPRTLSEDMAGTIWEVLSVGGVPAPVGRAPAATLIFGNEGALGGTLACNDGGIRTVWTASGGFQASRDRGFESTAVGCNDPAAEAFGGRFWHSLVTARSWRRDGERLTIVFADGTEARLRYLLDL
jgi:heat shock protein HslJ